MRPGQVFQPEVHILAEPLAPELAPAEIHGGQALDRAGKKPEHEECADVLVEEVGGAGADYADRRNDHQHESYQVEAVEQAQQAQGGRLEVEQDHEAVDGCDRNQFRGDAEVWPDYGNGQHPRHRACGTEAEVEQRGKFDQFLKIRPRIFLQADGAVPDYALRCLQRDKIAHRDSVGMDEDEHAEIVRTQGAGGKGEVEQAGQGRVHLTRGQHGGVHENPAEQAAIL